MTVEAEIEASVVKVRERLHDAARRAGRSPEQITLVAVSKKQPMERVLAYQRVCIAGGLPVVLGENYVQEFREKQSALQAPYRVHLIGPLQRNKAARAVEVFDVIESVHSFEIAETISKAAQMLGKVQDVFLQVNVSEDPAKSGWTRSSCKSNFAALCALPGIRVSGLMTITWDYDRAEDARPDFRALRLLREDLSRKDLLLSMGMSKDFEIAIEEGADVVRVGTALFGERGA